MNILQFIAVMFAIVCLTVLGICYIAIKYQVTELENENKKLTARLEKMRNKELKK